MRLRDINKEQNVKEKAAELLVNEGFQGFSMQKLAKACGISVATLYIYYKHKDDLIKQLGIEHGNKMTQMTMKGFSPEMSFAEGLKKQWENRAEYSIKFPLSYDLLEAIKHSPHSEYVLKMITKEFSPTMRMFAQNAIENKQLKPMSAEVYWSIAFGPLNALLRFHKDGRSLGNKPFKFSKELMYEALENVLIALKP